MAGDTARGRRCLDALASRSQVLVGVLAEAGGMAIASELRKLATDLPDPRSAAERLAACGLLIQVLGRVARTTRVQLHAASATVMTELGSLHANKGWARRTEDVLSAYAAALTAQVDEVDRSAAGIM